MYNKAFYTIMVAHALGVSLDLESTFAYKCIFNFMELCNSFVSWVCIQSIKYFMPELAILFTIK